MWRVIHILGLLGTTKRVQHRRDKPQPAYRYVMTMDKLFTSPTIIAHFLNTGGFSLWNCEEISPRNCHCPKVGRRLGLDRDAFDAFSGTV